MAKPKHLHAKPATRYVIMTPGKKAGVKLWWNGAKFIGTKGKRNGGCRRYLTQYVAEREATNVVFMNPHLVGSVFVIEG